MNPIFAGAAMNPTVVAPTVTAPRRGDERGEHPGGGLRPDPCGDTDGREHSVRGRTG